MAGPLRQCISITDVEIIKRCTKEMNRRGDAWLAKTASKLLIERLREIDIERSRKRIVEPPPPDAVDLTDDELEKVEAHMQLQSDWEAENGAHA